MAEGTKGFEVKVKEIRKGTEALMTEVLKEPDRGFRRDTIWSLGHALRSLGHAEDHARCMDTTERGS